MYWLEQQHTHVNVLWSGYQYAPECYWSEYQFTPRYLLVRIRIHTRMSLGPDINTHPGAIGSNINVQPDASWSGYEYTLEFPLVRINLHADASQSGYEYAHPKVCWSQYRVVIKKCLGERHIVEPRVFFY